MKRYQKVISIVIAVMVCVGITACSKDFDAKGYVQSALDAVYHGEYAAYAEFLDISEEEAQKLHEEELTQTLKQEFTEDDGMTEEDFAMYTEKMQQAYQLAKYEVQEAEKTEEGNYIVKVKVEPADVFDTIEESSIEVSNDKIAQGQDIENPAVLSEILNESIQKSIDKNAYGASETVEVNVVKDDSGAYGISESEMNKLEMAMFSTKKS